MIRKPGEAPGAGADCSDAAKPTPVPRAPPIRLAADAASSHGRRPAAGQVAGLARRAQAGPGAWHRLDQDRGHRSWRRHCARRRRRQRPLARRQGPERQGALRLQPRPDALRPSPRRCRARSGRSRTTTLSNTDRCRRGGGLGQQAKTPSGRPTVGSCSARCSSRPRRWRPRAFRSSTAPSKTALSGPAPRSMSAWRSPSAAAGSSRRRSMTRPTLRSTI